MHSQEGRPSVELERSRVLVADDSVELRALVRGVLERDGFEVIEAADGRAVLEHLGLGRSLAPLRAVDLIITDVRMPHVSGLEVLGSLRALHASVPVILMTAFGTQELHQEAHRLGAVMALDKPISLYSLRDAVRKLLDPPWW